MGLCTWVKDKDIYKGLLQVNEPMPDKYRKLYLTAVGSRIRDLRFTSRRVAEFSLLVQLGLVHLEIKTYL